MPRLIRYALAGVPKALAVSELARSNPTNPALFAVNFLGFPASNIQQVRQRALAQLPSRNAGSCETSISNTHAQITDTHKAQYHYHAMYRWSKMGFRHVQDVPRRSQSAASLLMLRTNSTTESVSTDDTLAPKYSQSGRDLLCRNRLHDHGS